MYAGNTIMDFCLVRLLQQIFMIFNFSFIKNI